MENKFPNNQENTVKETNETKEATSPVADAVSVNPETSEPCVTDGQIKEEYEAVSDELYSTLNEEDCPELDENISFDAEFVTQPAKETDTTATENTNQPRTADAPRYNEAPAANHAQAYAPPQQSPHFNNTKTYTQPPAYSHFSQPAPQPQAPGYGYYSSPNTPYPPAPPAPPKKGKGATALMVCLWVLVALFALGFFGLCGYIIGSNSNVRTEQTATSDIPTFFPDNDKDEDHSKEETTQEPTTDAPEPTEDKSDTVPLPDKNEDLYSNSVEVVLNKFPKDYTDTNKYTTQYAYKAVTDSTIGVVCYEEGFSKEPASQGTGIIISKDGYIATNSHVIGDSRSLYYVEVITNDGTTYEAKVIGYDSRTDLAVLKVNATDLTPATFCDSQYVEVGQDVIAVGNPGGIEFQNSLTRGVVSALNRELSLSSQVTYIQTDAAINPGNSGGPLCNMYGQVIGINTAKISSDSYEGMGFAIPSATVKEIVDDLISKGYVQNRVRLGISGTEVNSSMQQYYSVPAGILVGDISKDGPCDGKGIEKNDIITAIDDEKISSFSEIYAILAKHKPGDEVVLSVYKTEQDKTIEVTVILMADQGETQQ